MNAKENVTYKDIPTYYQKFFYKRNIATDDNRLCNICKKKLRYEEHVYILINNYKLFPNVILHKECFEEMGPLNSVVFLTNDYEEAKKYKHWFR